MQTGCGRCNWIWQGPTRHDSFVEYNYIGGGCLSLIKDTLLFGTIAGRCTNIVTDPFATIPGGRGLIAKGYAQTVTGVFNDTVSTLATEANFRTTGMNDPLFVVGNGTSASARSNAYYIANGGHAVVTADNRKDMITPNLSKPAIKGARYIDNTPIAWARISRDPINPLVESFGVTSASWGANGCTIILNYTDPYTGAQVPIVKGSSVVATLEDDQSFEYCKARIIANSVVWTGTQNQFVVRTFMHNFVQNPTTKMVTESCDESPRAFMVVVFGRP